jgi:hypothetical protein
MHEHLDRFETVGWLTFDEYHVRGVEQERVVFAECGNEIDEFIGVRGEFIFLEGHLLYDFNFDVGFTLGIANAYVVISDIDG